MALRTGKQGSGDDAAMVFSDKKGNVFDYPGKAPVFRTGRRFLPVPVDRCVTLPNGSHLFTLPERSPLCVSEKRGRVSPVPKDPKGREAWAVAAFLPSGYLRTYLPAYVKKENAPTLSLWAYTGVAFRGEEFIVPGIRIDSDPRSDPGLHQNDDVLAAAAKSVKREYPRNRLMSQLSHCAREYRCLCARNFFIGRYEAPVPTTPGCNAACLGCLSEQEDASGFSPSQHRLDFLPTPEEISQVLLHHLERVERPVASFGQGCEGEPLLRAPDLAEAVRTVRRRTGLGTIHVNTNGSMPDRVRMLLDAGIDSIRISLNSPTEEYYTRYYRPRGYSFRNVLESIELSLRAGIFVSLNLLMLPGFTDTEGEAAALFSLLSSLPVNMIQTRNLNIDPDYYLDMVGAGDPAPLGVETLLEELRSRFPRLVLGYYNPPKESWKKEIS